MSAPPSDPPPPPVSAYFTLETETEEAKPNSTRKKGFDTEVKFAKLKQGVQTGMRGAKREYDRIQGRNGGPRGPFQTNAAAAAALANRNENANPKGPSIPSPSLDRRSGEDFETDENIHLMKATSRTNLNLNGADGGGRKNRSKKTGCCGNCCKPREPLPRTVPIGKPLPGRKAPKFGSNKINNQKYNFITFLPICLFNQFKFFLNLFFLICAITQFIPELKVGLIWTYWAPLGFVLAITLIREAYDDFQRMFRDREINGALYCKHTPTGIHIVKSANIKVGDIITIEKDQRVPADMVLLRTTEKSGSCFIRTDQLDGETDWKLRVAVPVTQNLPTDSELSTISAQVYAEKPQKDIYNFIGTYSRTDGIDQHESLSVENMIWSNTVVASGVAIGAVVYTGNDTRAVMNTSSPRSKHGKLDEEVNTLTKILFVAVAILSFCMVALKGFAGPWYIYLVRYVLLFSYIIPISLRVNLDVAKLVYSWFIHNDDEIPGTVVRTSTLPEELGRIQYLLSDKTGTLTQNVMIFKRLHLGTVSYTSDTMDEIQSHLKNVFNTSEASNTNLSAKDSLQQQIQQPPTQQGTGAGGNISQSSSSTDTPAKRATQGPKMRRTVVTRVTDAVKAIAVCHNVTPVHEVDPNAKFKEDTDADVPVGTKVTYQASSPDEVALVEWCEAVGLALVKRDRTSMQLRTPIGTSLNYQILQIFPFKSETKRMGIIVKEIETGEITFYEKGADVVMMTIVQYNDWLEEETGNMAREGLRTLVVGKKVLTEEQYQDFENAYKQAKLATQDRNMRVAAVIESLERDLELLCLTGVEDKLQDQVRPTLELLRNAGIRIWMLTGDKMETATCIAKSSRLVSRTQEIHQFKPVATRTDTHNELNAFRRKNDCALVVQGETMETILKFYESEFMELTVLCPAVIICRCSPTQKAEVVRLLRSYAKKRTCAIGDGGNDVSMIQAADVGIGIVGKEGKQASLAADFSIDTFSYLGRLLMWHGRNSYRRSANLSQFIMHRGLLVSTMQAIFSSIFYFSAVPLFQSFLMVGYATIYTQLPVFSLVLDKDVTPKIAMDFPELYKELTKGRTLTFKTFFIWVIVSVFQGAIIMYGALLLFEQDLIHIVSITFTALLITEYLMIALTIETWHYLMIVAEFLSLAVYVASIAILDTGVFGYGYFDGAFLMSIAFIWKTLAITLLSCVPLVLLKLIRRRLAPPVFTKLQP